jgi:5-methylcytosine-specific restriction endonuclease McrA
LSDMHADHKTAWSVGGETSLENAQSLCEGCNTRKGAR